MANAMNPAAKIKQFRAKNTVIRINVQFKAAIAVGFTQVIIAIHTIYYTMMMQKTDKSMFLKTIWI